MKRYLKYWDITIDIFRITGSGTNKLFYQNLFSIYTDYYLDSFHHYKPILIPGQLKRIFAIVLLSVHLFNLGGYALLYQYYIHQADAQMVREVYSRAINDSRFIELKIPVDMPTVTDQDDYQVVAGQIELKDAFYNYVKFKATRDTLYFICLPNKAKTRLVNANIITAKEISDVPVNKKGDTAAKKINSLSEYNLQAFSYQHNVFGTLVKAQYQFESLRLNSPYIESPGKPPNFIS